MLQDFCNSRVISISNFVILFLVCQRISVSFAYFDFSLILSIVPVIVVGGILH